MCVARRGERHRDALAPGDLVLIYVARPRGEFIGRAELATAFHDWTPLEAEAWPADETGGAYLADIEEWPRAVTMDLDVQRMRYDSCAYKRPGERGGLATGVCRSQPRNTPPWWL